MKLWAWLYTDEWDLYTAKGPWKVMTFCFLLTEISAQDRRKLMLPSEMLNSWSCSIDHPSFLHHVEGQAWENRWVWCWLFSACYPACPKSSPDIIAVCYNCILDIPSSTLSSRCPLHCDSMGLLEDRPTAIFLSACPCLRNRLLQSVREPSHFFQGIKVLRCQWKILWQTKSLRPSSDII